MKTKFKIVGIKEAAYNTLRLLKYKTECNNEKILHIALNRLADDIEKGLVDLKKQSLEIQKAI